MSSISHTFKNNKVILLGLEKTKQGRTRLNQIIEPYWRKLSERERVLIISMVVFLLGLVFYFLIIEPAQKAISQKVIAVEKQQSDVLWMEQQLPLIEQLKSKNPSLIQIDERPIAALTDQTLDQFKLREVTKRILPEGNSVQLWMEKAPFDIFIHWIEHISRKGVTLVKVEITPHEEGLGNVDISLQIEK